MQLPCRHACAHAHALHAPPPAPHALVAVPAAHCPPEQHPLHDVASHAQIPLTQWSPVPLQLPVWHVPPQPSLAPHALPVQLAAHPQTPLAPAPPHVSGEAHVPPAQHACPLPPHRPHVLPQAVPLVQAVHATPPVPQACAVVPGSHPEPLQQPAHEVGSHAHVP